MATLHLITGGQRSGKSALAERLALELSHHPIYLATSRVWDEQHRQRIARHQRDRGPQWTTIEEEKALANHDLSGKVVVVDCITLWLTNFLFDMGQETPTDTLLEAAQEEFDRLMLHDATLLVITNEVGLGGAPDSALQMKFNDLQGWMNQYLARRAQQVTLMVCGIPVKIK